MEGAPSGDARTKMGSEEAVLFDNIESMHSGSDWGHLLDAGTGVRSLRWIEGLATSRWTAVTASPEHAARLTSLAAMRSGDRIVTGNWSDPELLRDETFDTVVVDHVLGALDAHAPFFQSRFLERLHPHVAGRLYLSGIAPHGLATSLGAHLVASILDLRDVIFLLGGWRPFREYPLDWLLHALGRSGFRVEQATRAPVSAEGAWVRHQVDGCIEGLVHLEDSATSDALRPRLEQLRSRALEHIEQHGPITWTADWCVWAERA